MEWTDCGRLHHETKWEPERWGDFYSAVWGLSSPRTSDSNSRRIGFVDPAVGKRGRLQGNLFFISMPRASTWSDLLVRCRNRAGARRRFGFNRIHDSEFRSHSVRNLSGASHVDRW